MRLAFCRYLSRLIGVDGKCRRN